MKKTIQTIAVASALFISVVFSISCQADDVQPANSGPMPQTREHILLARQVGVPLSLYLFGQPDIPGVAPMLGLLGTVNGVHEAGVSPLQGLLGTVYGVHDDGSVDALDLQVWRDARESGRDTTQQAP